MNADEVVALVPRRCLVGEDVAPEEVPHHKVLGGEGDNREAEPVLLCTRGSRGHHGEDSLPGPASQRLSGTSPAIRLHREFVLARSPLHPPWPGRGAVPERPDVEFPLCREGISKVVLPSDAVEEMCGNPPLARALLRRCIPGTKHGAEKHVGDLYPGARSRVPHHGHRSDLGDSDGLLEHRTNNPPAKPGGFGAGAPKRGWVGSGTACSQKRTLCTAKLTDLLLVNSDVLGPRSLCQPSGSRGIARLRPNRSRAEATSGNVKLRLPPRQSRGIS